MGLVGILGGRIMSSGVRAVRDTKIVTAALEGLSGAGAKLGNAFAGWAKGATRGGGREATGFLGSKGKAGLGELKNLQQIRNTPTTINGTSYSGHALDQMQNRGVMPSVVQNTLHHGTPFPTRAGTTGMFDSVNNVRVISNTETGQIVTVIRGAP